MNFLQRQHFASVLTFFIFSFVLMVALPSVESVCSENCRYGQDFCRQDDSDCLYGCNDGFFGQGCTQQCSILYCKACVFNNSQEVCTRCRDGHFGGRCELQCSSSCKNKRCDRYGRCMFGCEEHFHGDFCDHQKCSFEECVNCGYTAYDSYCAECVKGKYWNPYFSQCTNCSTHCVGGQLACNTTNGVCPEGCESRWYGYQCDKECVIDYCDKCTEVFHGTRQVMECAVCTGGYYTSLGRCEKCSVNCLDSESCDGKTGRCNGGCSLGWYGDKCNKLCQKTDCKKCAEIAGHVYCEVCQDGFYWSIEDSNCRICPSNCKQGCNVTNGVCLEGCKDGYYGSQCKDACGYCANVTCDDSRGHCPQGCQKDWFGLWCMSSCPIHCSSSNCNELKMCESCEAGWYGPQCESKCSETCQRSSFNNFLYCEKQTGACSDGCRPGYSGAFCNITCNENCFADICDVRNGNCEYGCKSNFYGTDCSKKCSDNCYPATRRCDKEDGKCLAGCRPGYYGEYCTNICNKNCLYGSCAEDGYCSSGCIAGFYGSNCTKVCSTNCLNHTCHFSTGQCLNSCSVGYFGSQCDAECDPTCLHGCKRDLGFCVGCTAGLYGDRCDQSCRNCYNDTCDQSTGMCTYGCVAGRYGVGCTGTCISGLYGRDCKNACTNCRENECDSVNGTCHLGCVDGWTGSTCQKKSLRIVEYKQEPDAQRSTIAISASASVGLVVTIVVIVTAAICRKRGKCSGLCAVKTKTENDFQQENQSSEVTEMKSSMDGCDQSLSQISSPATTRLRNLTIDPADLQLETTEMRGLFYMVKSGTLYHAQSQSMVMVKVLSKATQRKVQPEFLHDVEITRSLNLHCNILSYIGLCENESFIHSVFELCSSGDLRKYLNNLKRSSSDMAIQTVQLCYGELIKFVVDVLQGLIFLRNNKIIHRQVGSQNIYLDNDYTAKLGNFHFAIKYREEDKHNGAVKARKLPHRYAAWMPPEAREEDLYSHCTDMWGIGVLLWEIVTLGNNTQIPDSSNTGSPGTDTVMTNNRISSARSTTSSNGYLIVPKECDRFISQCMEQCWTLVPENRPSFTPMVRKLSASLSRRSAQNNEVLLSVSTLV